VPADRPPFEPVATAIALTEPPAVGETDAVFVRPVESFEDRVLSDEITTAGFGVDERERAAFAEIAPARFAAYREHDDYLRFLAFVDETPRGLGRGKRLRARAPRRWCRDPSSRARPGRLPRSGPGALGRGGETRHAGLGDPCRRHVPAILERVGFERVCDLAVVFDPQNID